LPTPTTTTTATTMPRYRITNRGSLPTGTIRITTVPRRVAARRWVAETLATQPQGRGVSNTAGCCERGVALYLYDARLVWVPCNAICTA
jgi:hypothetical protein